MATEKPKVLKITTPRGVLSWPKLNEPDYGTQQYPDPDGSYKLKLILDTSKPDVQAFMKKIAAMEAQAFANGETAFKALKAETRKKLEKVKQNKFWTEMLDQETEEPTGEIFINLGMKASGISKKTKKPWKAKPAIFDAKGQPMLKPPIISSGTVAKVSFETIEGGYFIPGTAAAGLRKKLLGVQIIELVTYGQRSASDLGFEEEDGYSYEPAEEAETSSVDTETTADASTDDQDF